MNFLRTQLIQRQSDLMKVRLDGQVWESQSILNIQSGHGVSFTQTETHNVSTLTVSTGGANGSIGYWGSFWDTTDQTITSTTTAYAISLNSADPDNDGVSVVSSNQITVANPGVYNTALSIQFTNNDSQAHEAVVWFRKNGVDVPDSASTVTVPSTHGGVNGHLIFYVDLALKLVAGDYLQLMWHATNTGIKVETLPAGTTPVYPASPSIIVSVTQV